jgi:capsular exopolysaccharide synthesis family protein
MPIGPRETLLYPEALAVPENESAIRRYWRIIYKHRWVVLGAMAACLALAAIASLLMPKQYSSTVRIQVAREAAKVVDIDGEDNDQSSGGSDIEFYQTQYALLKSRSLSERVAQDLNLPQDYAFLADYDSADKRRMSSLRAKDRLELATAKVNENTEIEPVRGSSIIDITFTGGSPAIAAKVANSVAENFIQSNLQRRFEAAAYARQFLQKQLRTIRGRLEDSERKSVQYAQQHGLIKIRAGTADNPTEQSLIASDLAELSTQLVAARAARAQAEAQYRAGAGGAAAAQALSSTTVNGLRQLRADLTGQLSKLESDFGPEYPSVVALKSQIAELDKQIGREQARVSSSVAADLGGRFRQAVATEQALQGRVDALKAQLLGEEGRSIQANILQRDVDTNRALYDALLQQYKQVGVAGGVGTNNVSIVDPALYPEFPSSPNLPLNVALGLLLGLIAGIAGALVLEQLAEAVILPDEFQSKLRIPLLGTTPAIRSQMRQRLLAARDPSDQDAKLVLKDNQSEISEAYFSILTSVQFSTANGAPETIAITSCQPREGKSTTALALSRGLAGLGSRILLIDADMRNPSVHRTFGLKHPKGLSDVLTGNAQFREVLHSSDAENLTVMTAGKLPPSPAELLASEALLELIKTASEEFDHIIFDSPPVLGLADAPLIARAVGGVIFVIEAGRTRSTQARHALERLTGVRAHILGAVLTKLDSQKAGYGYGYGYNYRYGKT